LLSLLFRFSRGVLVVWALLSAAFVLTRSDPCVDGLLVKPPDPPDTNGRDLSFGRVFADGDLVELEVFSKFLRRHHVRHWVWPPVRGNLTKL
jgi:hypothetical protein